MVTSRIISAVLFLLSAHYAYSQAVNATFLGSVTDVVGGTVAGARITLTETKTGINRTTKTNESGNYTFPDLPPGMYSVTAELDGFKRESRRDVQLDVNSSARVDMRLSPGSVNETIEVVGAPPLLQTDRTDTGRTIDAETIEELPLGVNRNPQSLLDLVPGTTEASFQHSQFFNASSSLQTQVNGQMRMGNNYQIEGIDNNERTGLLQILIPPAEAMQMISISTTNHDPELGRATGAVANMVLKSGGNKVHGALYELTQNSAWDARSFFNRSVGHLVYNRLGANIGGPIKKNKLFFFGDYLRSMDNEANTNTLTIPSAAFHNGDLSAGRNTVYDPASGDAVGAGRLPFTGNMIPRNRIDPVATKILAYLPPPNLPYIESAPANNYFTLLPSRKTTNQFDVKIDYTISDRDRLSGRFSFSRPVIFQAPTFGDAGGPSQGAFQGTGTQKTYSSGINYNRTITTTLLTEFRIGVAHYHNEAQQSDYGKDTTTQLGIPGVNVNEFTSGFVGINIGSTFSNPLTGYSASLPWVRAEANIDLVNSWTKIARNHTIKFGGDLRRIRDDLLQDQTFSPRGVITFGGNQTFTPGATGGTGFANNFAGFLLGLPSSVGRDVNTYFPAMRLWQAFLFVADNWQVNSKLTMNLGLRWEYYPPSTPAFPGGFSNYDFARNELVIAGVGGNPMNLGMVTHYKFFAPRLGLSYRLSQGTVIRAGFGMSYNPFPDNNYAYNFPVRSNNQYTAPSTYLPAAEPVTGIPVTLHTGFPPTRPVEVPANGIITNPDITSTYFLIPKDYKNPYVEQWNLSIQRMLPYHFLLDVAYVGSHGVGTAASPNLNASRVLNGGAASQPQNTPTLRRTAAVTQLYQGVSSNYNSMQVKFDRRFATGLKLTTSFTWQKGMSSQNGDSGGYFSYVDPDRNYARVDFDRTLNYVQSYIYDLPFGRNKRWMNAGMGRKVFGGWNVSGILSMRTGSPLLITANNNLNTPGSTQTVDQIAPVKILHGINVGNPWFDTSSFAQPPNTRFGTMGRNAMTGPGTFGLNAKIGRTFVVTEKVRAEVRAESFNVTNTAQFSNPNTTLTSANFGVITGTRATGTGVNGTGGGRLLQFAAKVTF